MTQLALMVLKTGQVLVSETEQLDYEPKVHLVNPYLVSGKTKVVLTSWPDYTDDEHVLLNSDSILTVCDPTEKVASAYLSKVGKKPEDFTDAPEPVILKEDSDVQQEPLIHDGIEDDGEYEPRYLEEALY